jgi:hypothetical protein
VPPVKPYSCVLPAQPQEVVRAVASGVHRISCYRARKGILSPYLFRRPISSHSPDGHRGRITSDSHSFCL